MERQHEWTGRGRSRGAAQKQLPRGHSVPTKHIRRPRRRLAARSAGRRPPSPLLRTAGAAFPRGRERGLDQHSSVLQGDVCQPCRAQRRREEGLGRLRVLG
eukprot:364774-Chlamydomonas_euryale.AAC.19